MELKKHSTELLKYKFEDVTFLIKPEAEEADRLEVILSGRQEGDDIVISRAERCKAAVRQMVVGWEGVKRDGADVPYSFGELSNFPHIEGKNVLLDLGGFIINNTDLVHSRGNDALKKE